MKRHYRNPRRSKLEIYMDILEAAKEPICLGRLMQAANINYKALIARSEKLIGLGLLKSKTYPSNKNGRKRYTIRWYTTTQKGGALLHLYSTFKNIFNELRN